MAECVVRLAKLIEGSLSPVVAPTGVEFSGHQPFSFQENSAVVCAEHHLLWALTLTTPLSALFPQRQAFRGRPGAPLAVSVQRR